MKRRVPYPVAVSMCRYPLFSACSTAFSTAPDLACHVPAATLVSSQNRIPFHVDIPRPSVGISAPVFNLTLFDGGILCAFLVKMIQRSNEDEVLGATRPSTSAAPSPNMNGEPHAAHPPWPLESREDPRLRRHQNRNATAIKDRL